MKGLRDNMKKGFRESRERVREGITQKEGKGQ
jgi:hypothetical protein